MTVGKKHREAVMDSGEVQDLVENPDKKVNFRLSLEIINSGTSAFRLYFVADIAECYEMFPSW